MREISGVIRSSSCWKVMDAGRSVCSFGGSSFFPSSRLILTTPSIFHCRHVYFVTTPCCFQAPQILCWGTGPPSSRLLFQFYFCFFFPFSDRPTQKSEDAFDNKRKKKGLISKQYSAHWVPMREAVSSTPAGPTWLGSLNNWGESAAFVMTSLVSSDKDDKP